MFTCLSTFKTDLKCVTTFNFLSFKTSDATLANTSFVISKAYCTMNLNLHCVCTLFVIIWEFMSMQNSTLEKNTSILNIIELILSNLKTSHWLLCSRYQQTCLWLSRLKTSCKETCFSNMLLQNNPISWKKTIWHFIKLMANLYDFTCTKMYNF